MAIELRDKVTNHLLTWLESCALILIRSEPITFPEASFGQSDEMPKAHKFRMMFIYGNGEFSRSEGQSWRKLQQRLRSWRRQDRPLVILCEIETLDWQTSFMLLSGVRVGSVIAMSTSPDGSLEHYSEGLKREYGFA